MSGAGRRGLSRRRFLSALAAGASAARSVDPLVIGFIYGGPKNDMGYNQAHAEGKASLKQLPFVRAVDEANVLETVAAEESMRNMIRQDGAAVIFPTSFGHYDPFAVKVAGENPNVQFFHCGGLYVEGKHPKNIGIYFGFIDEVEYLSGMMAGLMTRTGKLGFVAAKPIPQVLRNINSFTLGARSVRPDATTRVVFTGDWVMPVREAEASSSLADQGVDVLTAHTGSPRVVVQMAERRGIFACGYQFNQAPLAPRGFLTGAEWHWGTVYRRYAEMVHDGRSVTGGTIPRRVTGTLKDAFCRLSAFGPASSEAARAAVDRTKARLLDGSLSIYRGPIQDNTGKVVIPAGAMLKIDDLALDRMDWLVEGTVGRARG